MRYNVLCIYRYSIMLFRSRGRKRATLSKTQYSRIYVEQHASPLKLKGKFSFDIMVPKRLFSLLFTSKSYQAGLGSVPRRGNTILKSKHLVKNRIE